MFKSKVVVLGSFVAVLAVTVLLSFFLTSAFRVTEEKTESPKELTISQSMTVNQIAETNKLKISSLKEALKVKEDKDLGKTLGELGLDPKTANDKITKVLNFEAEEASKNFVLIIIKFVLWIVFLITVFKLLKKGKLSNKLRNYLLFGSFILFGAILGAEPNSMSTVTDMVSAYAIKGIIFPPRVIALLVLLLFVFLANKFVCGWLCQFGTLQEFIFRLNRDSSDKKGIFKQYKVPFVVTNTVRILFFIVFVIVAFMWSTNIIEKINPFTIFNPAKLSLIGVGFLAVMLLTSLFINRPWCHLFCPFGLVGWFVEKISRNKINVNYETCVACDACTKACPSNAMGAILKQDKVIPDCFACGSCINACPTKSVSFSSDKREEPPKGKFHQT